MTSTSISDPTGDDASPLSRMTALIASLVAIAVGIAVLLGWILDIDVLRRFMPGVTNPMVGTTAACFLLLGSALMLLRSPASSRLRRNTARALALAPAGVGLVVLGQYTFGWETGLDRFLFKPSALPFTGAMALPTAITFVFLGCAVLAIASDRRRGPHLAQILALIAGIAPLLGLVGRAYGVPSLSSFVAGTVVMALHTALTFLVLIMGILALRPRAGIMRTFTGRQPGGWLLRTLLVPAWAVIFVVGILRLLGERAGFYGTEFGTSLFAVANIVLLGVLMLLGARSFNRAEARRRSVERKLLESEHRSQAVLASLGDGVVTTDERGLVLSMNPAMESITGCSPGEVIGRLYADVFPIRDRRGEPLPPDKRLLSRAIATGEITSSRGYDISLTTKDGKQVPVAITAAPIFDQDGRVIGGVDVIRNVSHEREVDIMKSSLISTVSHELRTPLTMITGFAELLLNRDLDPGRAKHAAGQIHESALRLDRLVEDLLSVSRIDSGSLQVRPERLELSEMLSQAANAFAAQRSMEVEVHGEVEVIADRDMLHRILTNLLSNAVKYSPDGGAIKVAAGEDGNYAVVSVTDPGIGMSSDELSRLFQKFFRVDRPEVRNARGTGLGLYITRNLVELQGGRIEVHSTPGVGTTFSFTLPLAKERISI